MTSLIFQIKYPSRASPEHPVTLIEGPPSSVGPSGGQLSFEDQLSIEGHVDPDGQASTEEKAASEGHPIQPTPEEPPLSPKSGGSQSPQMQPSPEGSPASSTSSDGQLPQEQTEKSHSPEHGPLKPPYVEEQPEKSESFCEQSTCKLKCCSEMKPYHPSHNEIKQTSVVQETGKSKALKRRLCPASIFTTHSWITYCLTTGTIACYYCRQGKLLNLVSFKNSGEDAFCNKNFCDWKKCYEKLDKHAKSHAHTEAVMKVKFQENTDVNIAGMLDQQLKTTQEVRRACLLKQLSSMRYLARQGLAIRRLEEDDSNLIQLLKTRAEDFPDLEQWISDRKYLSHDIVNEL